MRKIKFRAWEKNLREIITVCDINFQNKIINTKSAWRLFEEIKLMQYTGIKDKNDKEIYENDIVKCEVILQTLDNIQQIKTVSFIGIVEMTNLMWQLTGIMNSKGLSSILFFARETEIIGNIYENPELIIK